MLDSFGTRGLSLPIWTQRKREEHGLSSPYFGKDTQDIEKGSSCEQRGNICIPFKAEEGTNTSCRFFPFETEKDMPFRRCLLKKIDKILRTEAAASSAAIYTSNFRQKGQASSKRLMNAFETEKDIPHISKVFRCQRKKKRTYSHRPPI